MAKSVTSIRFGEIGNAPVVWTTGSAYILRAGHKRWTRLKDAERGKIIHLKPAIFIRRYGWAAEALPTPLRGYIKPLRVSEQLVGFTRTTQTGTFGSGQGTAARASVASLQARRAHLERLSGIFDLGSHTYSGGPGFSWRCSYRIERLNPAGTLWDLLATDEETGEYQSMGAHSLEAAQEYFDGVGFDISRSDWEAMGATFPIDPEDETCAICHRSMSEWIDERGCHCCAEDPDQKTTKNG